MPRRSGPVAAVLCALLASSCGAGKKTPPAACTEGPSAVRSALAAAPGEVRIGDVKLSDCLTKSADADDVQLVGGTFVEAASELSGEATRRPESPQAAQLGYLLGAVQRGASRTQGIHSELLRRVKQEASTVDPGSRAFRRGQRAGRRSG